MVHWMNWIGSHRTKKSTNRWSSPPHLPRNAADKNDCDGHEPNTIPVATKNISNLFRIFKDIQNLGPTLKCKVHCPCPKSSTHFVLALQMSTKHALHIHVRIHKIVEYITTCAARFASGNGPEKVVALDGTVSGFCLGWGLPAGHSSAQCPFLALLHGHTTLDKPEEQLGPFIEMFYYVL